MIRREAELAKLGTAKELSLFKVIGGDSGTVDRWPSPGPASRASRTASTCSIPADWSGKFSAGPAGAQVQLINDPGFRIRSVSCDFFPPIWRPNFEALGLPVVWPRESATG